MSKELIELYYMVAITFTIVTSMSIMSFICYNSINFDTKAKRRFLVAFFFIGLASCFDTGAIALSYAAKPELKTLNYIFNFAYFAIAPLIPILLARIISNDKRSDFIPLICYGAYFIVLCFLTGFDQMFLIVDPCKYQRVGVGFYFYLTIYALSIVYLLIVTLHLSKRILFKNPYVLFLLFVILIAGAIAQIFIPNIYFQFLVIAMTTIIFYDYVSSLFSQMDGLTGLFNQYSFIKESKNIKEGEYIIVMDADDFKSINDRHGHLVGDKVLIDIAKIIQNVFGKQGKCYRYGGDEFVAVVKKDANIEELIEEFKVEILKNNKENQIIANVSIGYEVVAKGSKIKEIENSADQKMYLDKARHKAIAISESVDENSKW